MNNFGRFSQAKIKFYCIRREQAPALRINTQRSRKITVERTMSTKNFPRVKVFWCAMLNIYAIGCNSLKFAIAMNDIGCRHCRLFSKNLRGLGQSPIKSLTQTNYIIATLRTSVMVLQGMKLRLEVASLSHSSRLRILSQGIRTS